MQEHGLRGWVCERGWACDGVAADEVYAVRGEAVIRTLFMVAEVGVIIAVTYLLPLVAAIAFFNWVAVKTSRPR